MLRDYEGLDNIFVNALTLECNGEVEETELQQIYLSGPAYAPFSMLA